MAGYWDERLLADGGEIELIDSAQYWHARAFEARYIAALCNDEISLHIMLRLAEYYDGLARKSTG